MTVPGKCDVCRQRKVKCDEQRPNCGSCKRVGRKCQWTYGKFSQFVIEQSEVNPPCTNHHSRSRTSPTPGSGKRPDSAIVLTLRSKRTTDSGGGQFHTFTVASSKKKPNSNATAAENQQSLSRSFSDRSATQNPQKDLPSPQGVLILRLIALTGPKAEETPLTYMLGDSLNWVKDVIWQSEVALAAIHSLVDGLATYCDRSEASCALSRKSNAVAIRAVQHSLSNSDHQAVSPDLLLAIRTLFLTEVLLEPSSKNYIFHTQGLNNLLQLKYHTGVQMDDISRSIYYSSYACSLWHDIMVERDSMFDSHIWLQCSPPNSPATAPVGTGMAWQTIMQTGVRIARLIRLVRNARHFPDDLGARLEATELAAELFALQLELWFDALVESEFILIAPTKDAKLELMVADSFYFPSTHVSAILVQYWELRIMVCGCIQTLLSLPPLPLCPPTIDLHEVEQCDVRSANYILMSLEHIYGIAKICPAVELRSIFPLELAFSAWYRLEKREQLKSQSDFEAHMRAQMAREMQTRCLDPQNEWRPGWHPTGLTYKALQWISEILSGGDILPIWKAQHTTTTAAVDSQGEFDESPDGYSSRPDLVISAG